MKVSLEKSPTITSPAATPTTSQPFFAKTGGGNLVQAAAQRVAPVVRLSGAMAPLDRYGQQAEQATTSRKTPFWPPGREQAPQIALGNRAENQPELLDNQTLLATKRDSAAVPLPTERSQPAIATTAPDVAAAAAGGPAALPAAETRAPGADAPLPTQRAEEPAGAETSPLPPEAAALQPAVPPTDGSEKTAAGPEANPLGQIASAPKSAAQVQAAEQAQLLHTDFVQSDAQVAQLGAARQQQLRGQFAGAQQGMAGFITGSIASVQAFIGSKHAEIAAAAARTMASVRSAILGTLAAAQAVGAQVRARLNQLFESVTASVQGRVAGIANQITGVMEAVSLPNIPGIAQIRGLAVGLLHRAAGVVSGAFGRFLGFAHSVFNAGMGLVDFFLSGTTRLLDAALAVVSAAILGAIRLVGQALSRAAVQLGTTLRRALLVLVGRILGHMQVLLARLLSSATHRARALLLRNRNHYLASLADAVAPATRTVAALTAKIPAGEGRAAILRQISQEAIQNNRLIVSTFQLAVGGALSAIIRLLASAVAQFVAGLVAALARLIQTVGAAIKQAAQVLAQVAATVFAYVRELTQALNQALDSLLEGLRAVVERAVGQLMQFAQNGLSRIRSFISGFVQNLMRGRGVADSLASALGVFSISLRGPITRPPAGPITLPKVLYGLFVLFAAVGTLILFAVPQLAVVVTFLLSLGLTPLGALAVLAVLVLLVLVLVAVLLYLLYRWLARRRLPTKRVLSVTPSATELGVGGRDIAGDATIGPGTPTSPPLTWTINPGGTAPAGVVIIGSSARVAVQAGHPSHGTVVGGTAIRLRAALTSDPADFADSAAVLLVQVVSATYAAAPPLVPVPSLVPGTPPTNTAEPNRDGIAGNTARVEVVTAPATRPVSVAFRRPLGASLVGAVVTPGSTTGDIGLRISDSATAARLDETQPATVGPAALMADLAVNPVPLRVSALTTAGPLQPYGVINKITFAPSDVLHPLDRIVGELITNGGDDFNIGPPNRGFNPTFDLQLAVPANGWNDQLATPPNSRNIADNRPAIDVNRFVGPHVPQLPRRLVYNQGFQYASWQGAGTVVSRTFANGQHVRSLIGAPGAFQFRTEHIFGSVAAPVHDEPYQGNPLIEFTNVVATPTAPGATALAADGSATATLQVTSSVVGRTVNWSVLSGDVSIVAGNPAVLPAAATVRAGTTPGTAIVRATDTLFPNRRVDGQLNVAAVELLNMHATPNPVPTGVASATVSLNAQPGGRIINWEVDAAAVTAGVTVVPGSTGPGAPPMQAVVTRPAGFTGSVLVTASDALLTTKTRLSRIIFT